MGEGARPGAYRVDHDTSATEGMEFQLMNKFVVEALWLNVRRTAVA